MTSLIQENHISPQVCDDCNICCETYTQQKRKKIKCSACDFECCRTCIETYLLEQLTPSCMSCRKNWTDTFCAEELSSFMGGKWKVHQKDLLFEVEKSRFPETMPAVENVLKVKEWRKLQYEEGNQIYDLEQKIIALRRSRDTREENISRAVRGESLLKDDAGEEEKEKYQRACPNNDCNGFLSSQWKCGVCNIWVCKDCFEIKGDAKDAEHTCDPNTLLTARALKKETKPCPNCHCSIYKISGCDQMWCTQCHIAFSWRTGKKVRGHVHNPHYYQWVNNGGDAVAMPGADIPCGGMPHYQLVKSAITNINITIASSSSTRQQEISMGHLFNPDKYQRVLFSDLNLIIMSRAPRAVHPPLHHHGDAYNSLYTRTFHYDYKNKSINWMERSVSKNAFLSNIEKLEEYTRFNKDERKTFLENNWPNDYELKNRILRNNIIDYKCEDRLVLPLEIHFIKDVIHNMIERHSGLRHFEMMELAIWREKVNNNQDNTKLRIDYILKEITEKQMKTTLLKKERQMKKARAIFDVFELYLRIGSDSFRRMTTTQPLTYKILCEEWEKQEKVRDYCNGELSKFSKSFNLKVPFIKRDGRTDTMSWRQYEFRYNSIIPSVSVEMKPKIISEHWRLFKENNFEVKVEPNILQSINLWYNVFTKQIRELRGYRYY